jgi:hypothetical protein
MIKSFLFKCNKFTYKILGGKNTQFFIVEIVYAFFLFLQPFNNEEDEEDNSRNMGVLHGIDSARPDRPCAKFGDWRVRRYDLLHG